VASLKLSQQGHHSDLQRTQLLRSDIIRHDVLVVSLGHVVLMKVVRYVEAQH